MTTDATSARARLPAHMQALPEPRTPTVVVAPPSATPPLLADLPHWEPAHGAAALADAFAACGLVLLRGITSPAAFRDAATTLGTIYQHPHATASGLTHVHCTVPDRDRATAAAHNELGLTNTALTPHTDRAGMAEPPARMAFWLESQPGIGGVSTFVDGHRLIEELSAHDPAAVAALSRPGSVVFKSEAGLSEGSILTARADRFLLRFRFDHLVYLAPDVAERMPRVIALIHQLTQKRALRAGEGYVLDNHRWLHGRTHFVGARSAYRLLLAVPA